MAKRSSDDAVGPRLQSFGDAARRSIPESEARARRSAERCDVGRSDLGDFPAGWKDIRSGCLLGKNGIQNGRRVHGMAVDVCSSGQRCKELERGLTADKATHYDHGRYSTGRCLSKILIGPAACDQTTRRQVLQPTVDQSRSLGGREQISPCGRTRQKKSINPSRGCPLRVSRNEFALAQWVQSRDDYVGKRVFKGIVWHVAKATERLSGTRTGLSRALANGPTCWLVDRQYRCGARRQLESSRPLNSVSVPGFVPVAPYDPRGLHLISGGPAPQVR